MSLNSLSHFMSKILRHEAQNRGIHVYAGTSKTDSIETYTLLLLCTHLLYLHFILLKNHFLIFRRGSLFHYGHSFFFADFD